ncbi:hypothetical protein CBR_g21080 [Chara braunii]|uniref:Uncharacterized protein n=1 Tax=Chara braunii TaxID=69332 RepID=A0A388L0I9_CHABU|nr:hypothetical protein CBR_g21080 [Chara braunii]|eukprot:GBG75836.1 hypothetical protein CBR_g21080 [Chara braunii]
MTVLTTSQTPTSAHNSRALLGGKDTARRNKALRKVLLRDLGGRRASVTRAAACPGKGGEDKLEVLSHRESRVLQVVLNGIAEVEVIAMITLWRRRGTSVLNGGGDRGKGNGAGKCCERRRRRNPCAEAGRRRRGEDGLASAYGFWRPHVAEANVEVDLCEVLGSTEAIKMLGDARQGVLVLDCDQVEGAVVCAHAEFGGSAFLDEEATCAEGGGAWLNESFFKEFIELSVHFFGLGNGQLVGWSTWRSVTRFEINVDNHFGLGNGAVYYDGDVLVTESNGDQGVIVGGRETHFAGTSVGDEVTGSSVKENLELECTEGGGDEFELESGVVDGGGGDHGVEVALYFNKIDLKSGYHHIEVPPEDQHKTTLRTSSRLLDVINAAASYQKTLMKLQAKHRRTICVPSSASGLQSLQSIVPVYSSHGFRPMFEPVRGGPMSSAVHGGSRNG